MMTSHCDVTIWLEGEPTFDVRVTEGSAWVWAPGGVTIHTTEGQTGLEDLKVLAKFFAVGLRAVQQASWDYSNLSLPGLGKASS